eukprot:sb/3477683/
MVDTLNCFVSLKVLKEYRVSSDMVELRVHCLARQAEYVACILVLPSPEYQWYPLSSLEKEKYSSISLGTACHRSRSQVVKEIRGNQRFGYDGAFRNFRSSLSSSSI